MSTKVLKLGANPEFGIDDSASTSILLDSLTTDIASKSVEITDGNGAKKGEVIYDQTVSYNYTGTIMENPTGLPRIGEEDPIVDTAAYYSGGMLSGYLPFNCKGQSIVKNISVSQNAGQVTKITVSGERFFPGTTAI